MTNVVDVFDSYLKGAEHIADLGTEYFILMAITFLLMATGLISRNRVIQAVIVILMNSYQLWYLPRIRS